MASRREMVHGPAPHDRPWPELDPARSSDQSPRVRATTIGMSLAAWLVAVVAVALAAHLLVVGALVTIWNPARLLLWGGGLAVVTLLAFALPLAGMLTSGRWPRAAVTLAGSGLAAALVLVLASLGVRYALPAASKAHVDPPPPPPPGCVARAARADALGVACKVTRGLVTTPCPEGYSCTLGAGTSTCEIHCGWDCECPPSSRCVEHSCRR